MPATNTATTETVNPTPAAFTACALVQIRTENIAGVYVYEEGATMATLDTSKAYTSTTETGRIEFIPMGEWVLVLVKQGYHSGCWTPYTREDARAMYKAAVAGTHRYYRGAWTIGEATTTIVGSKSLPTRREMYSYGETAYMYVEVDFPAMTCPIIETKHYGKTERHALQPFRYTTTPTPGDRYRHDRVAIQWTAA